MKLSDLPPHLRAIADATLPNAQATAHLTEPRMPKPRRKGPTPEGQVLRACLDYLELRGIEHHRNNTGAVRVDQRFIRFGEVGSADIIGCLPGGRYLAVECKAKGKRSNATEAQRAYAARVNAAGGLAIVVDDVGQLVEAIEAALKGEGK